MPQLTELFQTLPYGPAPEAADAANAWLDSHNRKFDLFINNQWHPPAEGATLAVANPARGEPLGPSRRRHRHRHRRRSSQPPATPAKPGRP